MGGALSESRWLWITCFVGTGLLNIRFRRRIRNLLGGIVLMLGSIVLTLLAVEGVLMILEPHKDLGVLNSTSRKLAYIKKAISYPIHLLNFFSHNEQLGIHVCRPGVHLLRHGGIAEQVRYECNSKGFRGAEWAESDGRPNILLLGDSQTFGLELKYEHTFDFHMRNKLNANTFNTGVPGYDQWDEVKILKSYGSLISPKVIILIFYPNDLRGNSRKTRYMGIGGYLIRKKGLDGKPRNRKKLEVLLSRWKDGDRQGILSFLTEEARRGELLRVNKGKGEDHPFHGQGFLGMLFESRAINFIYARSRPMMTGIIGLVKRYIRGDDYYWEEWNKVKTFQSTIRLMDEINTEAKRLSAKLLIVAIPSPDELKALSKGDYYTNTIFVKEYGKRRNIPTVILAEHFGYKDYCKYYGYDMSCDSFHLSKIGARKVAGILVKQIRDNNMLK